MAQDKSKEITFQQDIIHALKEQGWLEGKAAGYDRENALYTEDLIGYVQDAWPERWQRLEQNYPNPADELIRQTTRALEKKGTLSVLRHGFRVPGTPLELCSFKPDHGMNPDSLRRYQANRLRVVQEVSYSPHAREGEYNPRLDLVLFINGIPVATLELKSEFKQTLENAKRQYRYDRPPRDPKTRKQEPLLTFKRGALVHFAVSQQEVAMTTKLQGADTFFLPFNQGNEDGGAGNPQPENPAQYATAYLWNEVLQRDNWLRIIGKFLHLEQKTVEDFHGRKSQKETLIFPRYHQWQVVNRLLASTLTEGPGQRYLIQHSAGSGKSNSIAWSAHQLSQLYDADGQRLFSSVIVVTDRTVLDKQLQETIYQFEHADGVVELVGEGSGSKSKQLAAALKMQKRIIVVTIQTFPALFEALEQHPELAAGNYAVIADEAHSSQTGSSANKLRNILGGVALADGEEISTEDLLAAAVDSRKPSDTISFYAFTATPKSKTLELFGRLPDPSLPRGDDNLPVCFHLYSMRQAIEEGFILDVLQRYTTYKVAYKLAHADEQQEVDSQQAKKKLARWARLHPHNIRQKVEIIVEHFRDNVRYLLDGHAKAMVVTSSRPEAVRYQLAMLEYIKEKGYDDVHPLVAFSGSVPADEVIPAEVTETSELLNPGLHGRDHAEALDSNDFNVMLVANKYQTGFDQPKLCAMYVDKKLADVSCVQTLSRLNRLFPGKETFILDFVNTEEEILAAFKPYYETAELSGVTDPMLIYDLKDKLDEARIYLWEEVEKFVESFFDRKAAAAEIGYYCGFARDRFKQRYERLKAEQLKQQAVFSDAKKHSANVAMTNAESELKEIGRELDELRLFRKNLQTYVRLYEFISQVVFYDDTQLEQLCIFAKHLYPLLRDEALEEDEIDLSELQLTHYRITKHMESALVIAETEKIKPPTGSGGTGKDAEKAALAEIIAKLNEIFGADFDDEDQLHFVDSLTTRMERDEELIAEIGKNSPQQIMYGSFPKKFEQALLHGMTDHQEMTLAALNNSDSSQQLAMLVLSNLMQRIQGRSGVSQVF